MKALVTGGAGFIGSNLVDALVARGDEVLVLDDLSTGAREHVAPEAELSVVSIADAAAVAAAAGRHAPEVVFHLAAQIDVRRSVADPAADARINVEGTLNVLAAAARGRRAQGRLLLDRRRDLRRRGDGADAGGRPRAPARALRPGQARGRGLRRALRPTARPRRRGPALRQRLRPAPGPARRGRRRGDLLRPRPARRARRRSTATAARPATSSTSTTSSRPTCSPRPRARGSRAR